MIQFHRLRAKPHYYNFLLAWFSEAALLADSHYKRSFTSSNQANAGYL